MIASSVKCHRLFVHRTIAPMLNAHCQNSSSRNNNNNRNSAVTMTAVEKREIVNFWEKRNEKHNYYRFVFVVAHNLFFFSESWISIIRCSFSLSFAFLYVSFSRSVATHNRLTPTDIDTHKIFFGSYDVICAAFAFNTNTSSQMLHIAFRQEKKRKKFQNIHAQPFKQWTDNISALSAVGALIFERNHGGVSIVICAHHLNQTNKYTTATTTTIDKHRIVTAHTQTATERMADRIVLVLHFEFSYFRFHMCRHRPSERKGVKVSSS